MAGIVKTVVRIGVLGGLLTGGAVLIAGPHRVGALANQLHGKFVSAIDATIDDPIAMRAQLHDLEAKYPKRIAEVRSQLGGIEEQTSQLQRDLAISDRVVALAMGDHEQLSGQLAEAQSVLAESGPYQVVRIAFDNRKLDLDEAYARANTIAETVNIYETRRTDLERDLGSLERDAETLHGLLVKLESEQAQFQTQIAQLGSQIDAIARRERMVDMMAERQRRIEELSRYEVASLDQFKAKLARKQAELNARLDSLVKHEARKDYEDVARFQVDSENVSDHRFKPPSKVGPVAEMVIEAPRDTGAPRADARDPRVPVVID